MTPPLEPSSPLDGGIRKRVCKACDRCRLKKSKCDGATPCSRCKADNAICVFGERKKSQDKVYPKGYVEMLESQQAQLVAGLQELYRRTQNGQGWPGSPLKETSHGMPLTHDILERLGVLKLDGHGANEVFEEDLTVLQQRLIADGAGFMQRQSSHDSHSDSAASPLYEPVAQRPNFPNPTPFHGNRFPPTPPNQSPFPQSAQVVGIPAKSHNSYTYPHAATHHSNLSWNTPASDLDTTDSLDFMSQFESPLMDVDSSLDLNSYPSNMFSGEVGVAPAAINPCLTMKDWAGQEDLQRYFNPTMI
ncbi:hypothetical protein A1O1_03071 [Capronia coronata CBS 617.96]|uniref:Zn(2)-C6 fungal-type domain-containing protein n=1 Tax=Capronia coronata CBS 617.96 TaxID=1182541 RepID=W9ZJI4_9EURO|nr:uncharacterized protein A1O1_03071 [Capronia coronata CBS 617.96]EXJ94674.1 hypothetical protein A1O1_03071 [Capronia coronata CBS 617.96]